ncbi:GIY-YIG nuclease family protein [Actinomycetospora sp. CA-084318]|uniref:GIY-YIG nuclease family protein n=1 Tax=Actinomycetospora sp. CA-084318 TaxID=3239892 RepID=UPI003D98A709
MAEVLSASAQTLVSAVLIEPEAIASEVPRDSGLYAWWASPSILPEFDGPAHGSDTSVRLVYVGLATNLRRRLQGNHMRRSGQSTLRRTLAGLLLDELMLRTRRQADRVVLLDQDEARLTSWMTEHLRLSWCIHPSPREVEADVIRTLGPPLNVDHATGPTRDVVVAARERYRHSAD